MLIARLRDKRRTAYNVALRQSLCYYLYNEDIPCLVIADVLGITERYVYKSIYSTKDHLEVGDKTTQRCMEEMNGRIYHIKPIKVDGVVFSKSIGHKLVIDNIIL